MKIRVLTLAVLAVLLPGTVPAFGAELLMFESASCEWCEVWDEEVGVIYAKTDEGKIAPLRRVDIFATRPDDLRAVRGVIYTPTFVLWEQGREAGRIIGYPGEDSFWGLLGAMVEKLGASNATPAASPVVLKATPVAK